MIMSYSQCATPPEITGDGSWFTESPLPHSRAAARIATQACKKLSEGF